MSYCSRVERVARPHAQSTGPCPCHPSCPRARAPRRTGCRERSAAIRASRQAAAPESHSNLSERGGRHAAPNERSPASPRRSQRQQQQQQHAAAQQQQQQQHSSPRGAQRRFLEAGERGARRQGAACGHAQHCRARLGQRPAQEPTLGRATLAHEHAGGWSSGPARCARRWTRLTRSTRSALWSRHVARRYAAAAAAACRRCSRRSACAARPAGCP